MIDANLSMRKTMKKMQSREGISVVHFVKKESDLVHNINLIINGIDKQITEMFNWSSSENLHLTIVRCSSIEGKAEYRQSLRDYIFDIFKNKSVIKIKPSQISLGEDGVIRLHFLTPIYTGLDTEILSYLSGGMKYREIRYPWITLAYAKTEYIESLCNSGTEITISMCKPDSYYVIDSLSIVKFYDTAFREFEKLETINLK